MTTLTTIDSLDLEHVNGGNPGAWLKGAISGLGGMFGGGGGGDVNTAGTFGNNNTIVQGRNNGYPPPQAPQ